VSSNPVDDNDGRFFVLVNKEEQQRLWPAFAEVPAGRRVGYGEAARAGLGVWTTPNRYWPDIRPTRLRERLAARLAFDTGGSDGT
jgi:MbtH protein